MTAETDLIAEGKPVDYIFFPGDPLFVSHGEFRLENRTARAMICLVHSAHFVDNDTRIPLDIFHLYAGDRPLGKQISIAPASELNFRIAFPARAVSAGVKLKYGVRLSLQCNGGGREVTSKLNVIREMS